ncbi:hypothetical protein DINM_006452 [Dirofilaria immitis]|nr:hypothetical protein [Dirofilaria immitis]
MSSVRNMPGNVMTQGLHGVWGTFVMMCECNGFHFLLSSNVFRKMLVESLLDGTVFAIVESLSDLQRMNEIQLYNDRQQRLMELQCVPDLDEQMKQIDINIVTELDKIVTQQQDTLCRAGVPSFRITNSPREIELQMAIISFILTVHARLP